MTGYESYGVVEACGPGVTRFSAGDRVVGFYGHRSHAFEPQSRLIPVPPDLDPRLALLAILSCDVKRGVLQAAFRPGEAALITGAGAIGLLTLFVLRALGTSDVDVVAPQEARRVLARKLGARTVFEVSSEISQRFPVGFECSSRNAAFTLLQEWLEPQGRLCVLSDGNLEPLVLAPGFHEKELRVLGSSDGRDYPGHAAWFYHLEGLEELRALFELEVSAPDLPQAFADMSSVAIRPVKVLVRYQA